MMVNIIKIPSYIIALLIVISCTNQQTENHNTSVDNQESNNNSSKVQILESNQLTKIDEPFQVSEIEKLKFTSGAGKEILEHKKCDSSNTGFYGSYYLIDPEYADEFGRPVAGIITVHSYGKMSNWKTTDTDQTIWEIHLKSDVISVWDSIKVGMTRKEIENFGKTNNVFYAHKEDTYYSCEFDNFSIVYIFQKDTLKELTVNRKCEKITNITR